MADIADNTDAFVEGAVVSGVEISRLKLLSRELAPKGICHYCEKKVDGSQLYCDSECGDAHAYELKRRKELGR